MCRRLYFACVLGALALAAAPAWASARAEQREGAQTLRSVEDGERPCETLETDDYERIGARGEIDIEDYGRRRRSLGGR